MNDRARAFFAANPDAPYWYYSDHIRIPNPKMRDELAANPHPWPDHHKERSQ